MRLQLINREKEFFSLKKDWNSLLDKSNSNVFLRWEWLYCWWDTFQKKSHKLHILLAWDKNELVGISPTYIENKFGIKILRFLGDTEVDSCYLDFFGKEESFLPMLNYFGDCLIYLKYLSKDSMITLAEKNSWIKLSTCLGINLPKSSKAYLSSVSRKSRANLRRSERKLADLDYSLEILSNKIEMQEGIADVFRINEARWKHINSHFSKCQKKFLTGLVQEFAGNTELVFLKVEGKRVAYQFNMMHNKTVYFYSGTFVNDEQSRKYSYGLFLFYSCLKRFVRHYDYLDMLRGDLDHKRSLCNNEIVNYAFLLPGKGIWPKVLAFILIVLNKLSNSFQTMLPGSIQSVLFRLLPRGLVKVAR